MTTALETRSPTTSNPPGPTPHPAPRRWTTSLVVAAYVALGLLVVGRYLPDVQGRISGHLPTDNVWFQWLLSHGAYSVRHLQNPLFSVQQNYPTGVNMMANTSVLGVTIPLAPLTMLLGPRTTYVMWMAGACAATAGTTYRALSRHLVRSRAAAFVGGALAGFAPGVIHHANGQPNFVSNFLVPVIAVKVAHLGRTGRWARDGSILGLLVTYQLFINEEVLLITAAACGVAGVAYTWQQPIRARQRATDFLRALGVTAGVAGVLCAYPIWFQFNGPQAYRGLAVFHSWGEDVVTYVTMPRDTLGGTAASESVVGVIEQNTWFGWPLTGVVLILLLVLWRRSATIRVAGVVGLVFAVAALGPVIRFNGQRTGLPGPWSIIPDTLPVLGLLMPSRLSYAVIAVFVIVVAVGWDELAPQDWPRAPGRPDATLLGRMVIAAALVPLVPTPVPTMPADRTPQFITSGAWRPYVPAGSTLVPVPLPDNGPGLGALQWSADARHEFAVPRGYFLGPNASGDGQMGAATTSVAVGLFATTARTKAVPIVSPATRAAVHEEIRQWRGAAVVLGPHPAEAALRTLLDDLFGPGRRVRDVWVWDVRRL
ncbi:MAG TPA: hypothetical protein VF657_15075 [Actinoplanes sp.]|jgi:hypothetical protein